MRILLLGLNYYPELVGIGRYTGELATYLAQNGVEIRVITTPPYYPAWEIAKGYSSILYQHEKLFGVEVTRCPLWVPRRPSGIKRLLHLWSFALSSFPIILFEALKDKPDIVMCVIPTLFSAPFALLAARISSSKSWLHIQDFELDAAFGLDILPGRKLFQQIAQKLESLILTRFDHISTISENMRKRCIQKGVQNNRISLFINWVDTRLIHPLNSPNSIRAKLRLSENQVIVLYHGNMGRKQGLEILLECAERLQENKDITFVLCGEGAARRELELQAGRLQNLYFMDLQPEAMRNELVNLADIHVLPQLSNAADLVMPSKLTSMLASGKAVIACADSATQIWEVVSQVGVVIPPENGMALEQAIVALSKDFEKRERLGQLGRDYANKYLEKNMVLSRFLKELKSMVA